MQMRRLFVLSAATLLVLWSAVALGFAPDPDSGTFEIQLPTYQFIDQPDNHFAAVAATDLVTQRYGGHWRVSQWDQFSRTPVTIYGSGVELASGGLNDDRAAEVAATDFVAANPEVLGVKAGDLVVDAVARGLGKVAVHFRQLYHGVPVIGATVRTLFTESGRLYAFGSSAYRDIDVSPVPVIGERQAISIAENDLPFDPARDAIEGAPELMVLPIPQAEGGAAFHLVWRIRVRTQDPFGLWVTHVDAQDGTILYRYNDVHAVYSGTAQGDVDNVSYCDGADVLPFREMTISVSGAGSDVTDASGQFSIPGGAGQQTVSAQFDGPQQNVNNQQGADAQINTTIQDGVPITLSFTDANSHAAERDAFYWVNETDAFVKGIDNTYNHGKYTTNVNVNSTCNANWNGNTMNFFREGGGCANTGTIADVMAHEFGHGVQSDLLGGTQGGQGLGEGNGDIEGTFMIDDSIIGRGFFLGNCVSGIRDCDNNLQYPADVVGQEIHDAGRVICGFHWDARLALETTMGQAPGETWAANLWHFGRKIYRPTVQPDQVLSYFLIDDDDGNLDNGTPHHAEICVGATNHGFSCPEILVGVLINHTPLPSTTVHNVPFTVSADITTTIEGATITDATLFYRLDGGAFVEVAMQNVGGETYEADIPAQSQDALIEYYIYGRDSEGNERTDPRLAPNVLHSFYVATVIDELEAASGWTVGAPGDDATTGIWERVDPIGTSAQPEDDHTPDPGIQCFVTGQCSGPHCSGGCTLGCNDVDGGKTTLLSPVYDLSQATQSARVAYYRWYSNQTGADPGNDWWVVDVSNDGGTSWTSVENVNPPAGDQTRWVGIEIDLIALFGTPDQVQLRFIASDENAGSLVEAGVDDLVILTQSGTVGVESEAAPETAGRFTLHEPHPNPFNPRTEISYETPASGRVEVTLFDAAGRQVRTLLSGVQESGAHSIEWDGRDDSGRALASGVYHVRIQSEGATATRKMVLLK